VTQPTVLVIGCGYGGIRVARALDDVADVTLVEPKDAFDKYRAAHAALMAARRVLIIGAGPVGLELAGERDSSWAGGRSSPATRSRGDCRT
jgi:NADH dehydrogenase FAD-containing subunit